MDALRRSALLAAAGAIAALAACESPPRGDCEPHPPAGRIGSICGFRNPEDVEAVASRGLLLVSQMADLDGTPGSIAGLSLDLARAPRVLWPAASRERAERAPTRGWGDPGCPGPPDPARFMPHGISAGVERPDGELPLAVVVHGEREAVELFALSGAAESAALDWRGCVALPPDTSGNDLELQPDGSLVIANYMPSQSGLRALFYQIAGGLGRDTGDVLLWTPGQGFRHLPGSAGPTPNGVLRSRDGRSVFAAQTGSGNVVAIDLERGAASPIRIGGHPDNLSFDSRGQILVASHLSGLAFLRCAAAAGPCRAPWTLHAIDPGTRTAREILRHDGSAVGGIASAARVGDRIFFGAVFGDRIGVVELE